MAERKKWRALLKWPLAIVFVVAAATVTDYYETLLPEWVKGILFFGTLGYIALYFVWDTMRERRELRELHAHLAVRKEAFARFKEKKARVSTQPGRET